MANRPTAPGGNRAMACACHLSLAAPEPRTLMVLAAPAGVPGRVAQQRSVCPWRRNGVHRPTASHSAPRSRVWPAGSTRREAGAASRRVATHKAAWALSHAFSKFCCKVLPPRRAEAHTTDRPPVMAHARAAIHAPPALGQLDPALRLATPAVDRRREPQAVGRALPRASRRV